MMEPGLGADGYIVCLSRRLRVACHGLSITIADGVAAQSYAGLSIDSSDRYEGLTALWSRR